MTRFGMSASGRNGASGPSGSSSDGKLGAVRGGLAVGRLQELQDAAGPGTRADRASRGPGTTCGPTRISGGKRRSQSTGSASPSGVALARRRRRRRRPRSAARCGASAHCGEGRELAQLALRVAAVVVAQTRGDVDREAQPAVVGHPMGRAVQRTFSTASALTRTPRSTRSSRRGRVGLDVEAASARVGSSPEPANFFVQLISIVVLNSATSISMLRRGGPDALLARRLVTHLEVELDRDRDDARAPPPRPAGGSSRRG